VSALIDDGAASGSKPTTPPAPIDVKIGREELFAADVNEALVRQRALRGRATHPPEPVSFARRILLSSMFYLPLAGLLGAAIAACLIEPFICDSPHVAGAIALVNADPFDTGGLASMTIGNKEVLYDPTQVHTMKGERGQPAFRSADEIQVGTVVEVVGSRENRDDGRIVATAIRRATEEDAARVQHRFDRESSLSLVAFFPATATLIALGLLLAENISRRNWSRMVTRGLAGSALAALFAVLALLPAGIVFTIGDKLRKASPESKLALMAFVTGRSIAWACVGAGLGVGMNIARATRAELRNTLIGGALGGAFGGLFFDPVDWLVKRSVFEGADTSRLVGACAIGVSVGVFVALLERLTREAWIRVRTGPLAGKSFILYRSPTTIGSSPTSDVYLFKDAGIDPHHASIHRVGQVYEIEDQDSREGTEVGGRRVRRRRLSSGDQIQMGGTVLEFEERARRMELPASDAVGRRGRS
jgi:hypothetical protein